MDSYFLIGAVPLAVLGAASDVRTKKIPNWLTYSGLFTALLFRLALAGWAGLGRGVAAVLVAGGIFFLLFLLGGMGGGDVKLMASVAAWAGSGEVKAVLIAAAIAGGALAVLYVVAGKRIWRTLLNVFELTRHHVSSGLRPHPSLNVREGNATRVPYGLAIAMGTLFCVANIFWWR
ncbi:MAG TPA: prepilin peptidase [Terriglobales bacterium]|nr:prepilin peptidase [Terriglobales bacterium]